MKRIAILGSTGSIGNSTLHVARHLKEEIKVVALAAKANIDVLEKQAREFHPQLIGVYDKDKALELQKRLPNIQVLGGLEGIEAVASHSNSDMVISAMSGTLGLIPTISSIKAGKQIGLANKEALVSGGALVMALAREKNVPIIPIDSEHSALFQCLRGESTASVHKLIITASGGPFRTFTNEQLNHITIEHALAHPTWNMGPKITIDSSTLMNKGLEVIEAHWLFGIPIEKIEVVVHPQSIIHSIVEFIDNSLMAQMGDPCMVTPIQYAITYPRRCQGTMKRFDFMKNHTLQFFQPDPEKFRCLSLAFQALKVGGSLPCYMNASNEILVQRFLNRQIGWKEIGTKLEQLMQQHTVFPVESLDTILHVDTQARREAAAI